MAELRKYTTRRGDTLVELSEKWYGTPNLAGFIFDHNKAQIANPNSLLPNVSIVIPYHEAVMQIDLV